MSRAMKKQWSGFGPGPTQIRLYSYRRWLEAWISDLESRGIALCIENKGADQLRGNREDDLRFCFEQFWYDMNVLLNKRLHQMSFVRIVNNTKMNPPWH